MAAGSIGMTPASLPVFCILDAAVTGGARTGGRRDDSRRSEDHYRKTFSLWERVG